jgi:hypothetical protein
VPILWPILGQLCADSVAILCQFCTDFGMIRYRFWDDLKADFGTGFEANFGLIFGLCLRLADNNKCPEILGTI